MAFFRPPHFLRGAFLALLLIVSSKSLRPSPSLSRCAPSIVREMLRKNVSIFNFLIFTRWKTPAVFRQRTQLGEILEPLTYADLKNVTPVRRWDAMRAGLSRTNEFDFRTQYPDVFHKFDAVVFIGSWTTPGVLTRRFWSQGKLCSCFIEVPEGREAQVSLSLSIFNEALSGMAEAPHYKKGCQRFLVLGGSDTHLSLTPVMNFVRKISATAYFNRIYYEAMDVHMPNVEAMPIGFTDFYTLSVPPGIIEQALTSVSISEKCDVLVAWGTVWPQLDKRLSWRKALISWVEKTAWIERQHISMDDWYLELAKYRFYVVPDGNGVASPKWAESLLLQTIPIVPPLEYYKKLRDRGYPFVVVDSWDEITHSNMEKWWSELSSKLEKASWMHTSRCWWELLSGGHLHIDGALELCVPSS